MNKSPRLGAPGPQEPVLAYYSVFYDAFNQSLNIKDSIDVYFAIDKFYIQFYHNAHTHVTILLKFFMKLCLTRMCA